MAKEKMPMTMTIVIITTFFTVNGRSDSSELNIKGAFGTDSPQSGQNFSFEAT